MYKYCEFESSRSLRQVDIYSDFTVVGGGLAGVCAAITAARRGVSTVLVQDRPVLGGNASSEVRLWALGATAHQGNNNRYAREGGLIDEIMLENLKRNPEGNPVLFDMVLLDKVLAEKKITLLLNTAMISMSKSDDRRISGILAVNSQNGTEYHISSELFCDASGDGTLAYLAGASFRIGTEDIRQFGEKLDLGSDFRGTQGHTIFFYSKDTGHPVKFVAPEITSMDVSAIIKNRTVSSGDMGCQLWWIELSGDSDNVFDTESIKMRLWSIVYGIWNTIKNSGDYEGTENLTLEWVGLIPGKRESRRFVGYYTLCQSDIITQRHFDDAVAFGGWAIDIHPDKGVYSNSPPCYQYHSKGVYSIPYRCLVSKDIDNLFLGGRTISTSHIAYGSVRVMMTLSHCAQAIGMAASLCIEKGIIPYNVLNHIEDLQQRLAEAGQSIPGVEIDVNSNRLSSFKVSSSSQLVLGRIPFDGGWRTLDLPVAQMLPFEPDVDYGIAVEAESESDAVIHVSLKCSSNPRNFTPDVELDSKDVHLSPGLNYAKIQFSGHLHVSGYAFICFSPAPGVRLRESKLRITGIMPLFQKFNGAVAKSASQCPPEGSGIDAFDFWLPERRPGGANIAMDIEPPLNCFGPDNLSNGLVRPLVAPNAFVASPDETISEICLESIEPVEIKNLRLFFDTDFDSAVESIQMGHPENIIPFCVRNYQILDGKGNLLADVKGNYQTVNSVQFFQPVALDKMIIRMERPMDNIPASLFSVLINYY